MDIKTKYNIGDRVWTISTMKDVSEEECPECGGDGIVVLKSGEFQCPCCGGEGIISRCTEVGKKPRGPWKIEAIDINIESEKSIVISYQATNSFDTHYLSDDCVYGSKKEALAVIKDGKNGN